MSAVDQPHGEHRLARISALVLGVLVAVPVLGLGFLLVAPGLDVRWEHHPSHFWLVLGVAAVNVALAVLTSEAATLRGDSRLFLVSLAMLSSAGFLGLHALATPGVLLEDPNQGFAIATPVGLFLASGFAAASALVGDRRTISTGAMRWIRAGLLAVIALWALAALAEVRLLSRPPDVEAPAELRILASVAVGAYAFAAIVYLRLYLRRRRTLPLAIAVAFVLLAEAMIAIAVARSWRLTWWEWHVLMAIAFGTILIAARTEYRRTRSVTGAFAGIYLERTLERLDRRHASALAELVEAIRADDPLTPVLERLRAEGFTTEESSLLERSARELARVDSLFRSYVGPRLAERLAEEPSLATLGGRDTDVTVVFADLAGFTSYSEGRPAADVIEMLNAYWEAVVPLVVGREGGLIERFAGDAIMVVFNALDDQQDHPRRAARAAVGMRDAAERVGDARPDWPRFRIGLSTGRAAIGNVGAGDQRSFAAIGDTTNVAARLQAAATPGRILMSATTRERLGPAALAEPLGPIALKGKEEPVEVFELVDVDR
jgi:class 3 adenylate cyclase